MNVNLGSVEQIAPGLGKCFVVEGEEIAVFRGRDGRVFAIQNMCPHRKVPLSDGIIGGNVVVCPGHGHEFNLETGEGGEAGERVRTFKVWEKDRELFLEYNG